MNEILKKWMNPHLIEEMEEGVINAPQDLLGMHFYEGTQMFVVRRPVAQRVWITDVSGETAFEAEEKERPVERLPCPDPVWRGRCG